MKHRFHLVLIFFFYRYLVSLDIFSFLAQMSSLSTTIFHVSKNIASRVNNSKILQCSIHRGVVYDIANWKSTLKWRCCWSYIFPAAIKQTPSAWWGCSVSSLKVG
jgi:hypothetical protein